MKKRIFFLGIILFYSATYSQVAFADKIPKPYKLCALKKGGTVNVYREPTTHSGSICKLSAKSKGIIKRKGRKKFRHSKWQKISWQSKTGWIKNGCLKPERKSKKAH